MSICANCEKAKVKLEKNNAGELYHYVKCLADKWTRKITVFNETLRFKRDCLDYSSMGDEFLNEFLADLPRDRVEYENRWQK